MTSTIDASFLSRALVPSQLLPEALDAMRDLTATNALLIAPPLVAVEFASAIRRLETRSRLTATEAAVAWRTFRDLNIALRFDIAWVERAREIAVLAGLSKVYDATYLACAEALDAEFVTCDELFVAALPAGLRARVRLAQSPK